MLAPRVLPLVCYGALVAFLTWPLVPNAATHLPATAYACKFDSLYSGWALAHQTTALLTDPRGYAQGNDFHPARDTLYYGPTGLGALPYFGPVFAITGNPTLALNFTLLASLALTAWALHLVVLRWTGSHLGGAVAACSYLLTRWTLWEWLPTTPHISVLQYFPFVVLLAAAPATGVARNFALLALVVVQCLTDLVYVAPAVLGPLAILACARLARRETRRGGAMLLGVVVLAGLVLLAPASGHLRVRAANPDLERQAYWPIDPEWLRDHATRIPAGLFAREAPTALPVALVVIAIGAVFGARTRHSDERSAWRAAVFWSVVGTLMSLTPTVQIGEHSIALPQELLARWVPLYGHIRVPSRLGVAALIGLALMAGLAFAACARRIALLLAGRRSAARAASAALALVVLASMYASYRAYVPPSLRPGWLSPFYRIAPAVTADLRFSSVLRQPGGALLELPARLEQRAWAPIWNARAMYRSIFHGRAVLNGYASYWPAGFPERMALASRIPDPEALAELRRTTGLELVWMHVNDLPAVARSPWIALAERGGRPDFRLVARDGDELLFAVAGGE